MKHFFLTVFLTHSLFSFSEIDSLSSLMYSVYGEAYFGVNTMNSKEKVMPDFIYNHKELTEPGINLALVKLAFNHPRVRLNTAIMFGDYSVNNLSAEPLGIRFLNEANLGVKLLKHKSLWIDAGILNSHIGFESAIGADCWNLTRSLMAENSPYYESGIRLSYTSNNEVVYFAALLLNGWQRVYVPKSIEMPSVGIQFTFKKNTKWLFNYSNFIGLDNVLTDVNTLRLFNNIYIIYESNKKWSAIAAFDIGFQGKQDFKIKYWITPNVSIRYKFNQKTTLSFRTEYYYDPYNVIVPSISSFSSFSSSLNADYDVFSFLKFRLEGRYYYVKESGTSLKNMLGFFGSMCLKISGEHRFYKTKKQ